MTEENAFPTFPALTALIDSLVRQQKQLVTAESCTGGLMATYLTSIAGSSTWFERGFITYSNAAKIELLGLSPHLLDAHGAVSAEVVAAMAEGALLRSQAQVSVAISGVAGPDGGSENKPVGCVWVGWAGDDFETAAESQQFSGDRHRIRLQATEFAFSGLVTRLHTRKGSAQF